MSIRLWNREDQASGLSESPSLRWNDNIKQVGGEILIVSQFTLLSQLKGNKVDFHRAMKAGEAKIIYEDIVRGLNTELPNRIQTGIFGAMMQVEIVNDGRKSMSRLINPSSA